MDAFTSEKLLQKIKDLERENELLRNSNTEIKEREDSLLAVLNNTPAPIYLKSADYKYILINKQFQLLSQMPQEDIKGKNDYDVFPKPMADLFRAQDEEVNQKNIALEFEETVPLLGKKYTFITSKFPVHDQKGNIVAIGGFCTDITERVAVQNSLQELEAQLQHLKKLESIGLLAGGIAHDFNNLLTAILGNINLALAFTNENDKTYPLLTEAEHASLRAQNLTQQLLTFSKGGQPIKEVASILEVVQDSADFVLRGSNVRCEYNFQDDLNLIEIDTGQIGQVIQNIVINANQSMPKGGVIKITCKKFIKNQFHALPLPGGKYIKLTLADHGTGIHSDHLGNIFDPYFTTKQEGNGLGLAISHSIINKHNGHIAVDSHLGSGTTFHIYLPAKDVEHLQPQALHENIQIQGNARVLVMDDEEMVRTVAKSILSYAGYEVYFAKDGQEAISTYQKTSEARKPIDITVMDLTVPGGMGGEEAVKEILKINPQAKVIVTSGYFNDPIMSNFRDHGFCAAIAKPFQFNALIGTINKILC
ncbi:MAG: PAS domain-containing protein [Desulfobulbaceae bacterium]|nr:PAS domain-containing protein [Desulfobulbaceae bacterium]